MNLLGHFVCARHLPPEVQAGSALGDLLPLYRRRVRPLALAEHWERNGHEREEFRAIARGVRFHLAVDSHFHRAPLFTDLAGALQRAMREASDTPGLKRFFPAHILAEMFLDHLLIEQDAGLPGQFYALFAEPMPGLLTEFARAHPEANAESFRAYLARFVADRFVDGYRDVDRIVARIQRMLTGFGQRALEGVEIGAIRSAFARERARSAGALLQFVASMRHAVGGAEPGSGMPRGWPSGAAPASLPGPGVRGN